MEVVLRDSSFEHSLTFDMWLIGWDRFAGQSFSKLYLMDAFHED